MLVPHSPGPWTPPSCWVFFSLLNSQTPLSFWAFAPWTPAMGPGETFSAPLQEGTQDVEADSHFRKSAF